MTQPITSDYASSFSFLLLWKTGSRQDHPACFLGEFVDRFGLPALNFAISAATEGRPPYHPRLLLKVWLYGYFRCIRSTRKLEAAHRDHLPLLGCAA